MPIFEFQGNDGKVYEVDAPDAQQAAMHGQKFNSASRMNQFNAAAGKFPDETYQNVRSQIDARQKGVEESFNTPDQFDDFRKNEAAKIGKEYGLKNAPTQEGVEGFMLRKIQASNAAKDSAFLGLPNLYEAYAPSVTSLPEVLGGKPNLTGAEAHEFIKAAQEGTTEKNPWAGYGGNIAGGVLQSILLAPEAVVANTPKAGMLWNAAKEGGEQGLSLVGRLLAQGGTQAALGGTKSLVDSRGVVGEAATDAAISGGLGVAGQGIGEAVGKVASVVANPVKKAMYSGAPEQQAAVRVQQMAKKQGITPEAIDQAKKADPAGAELSMLVDNLGDDGVKLMRTLRNSGFGDSGQVIERALTNRVDDGVLSLKKRLMESVGLEKPQTIDDLISTINAKNEPKVTEAYNAAKAAGYDLPPTSALRPQKEVADGKVISKDKAENLWQKLQQGEMPPQNAVPERLLALSKAPEVQKALDYGERIAKQNALAKGAEFTQFDVYNEAAKHLNDQANALGKQGYKNQAGNIGSYARDFKQAFEESLPEWGGARQAAMQGFKQQEAAQKGADLIKSGKFESTADEIAALGDDLRPFAAKGYVSETANRFDGVLPQQAVNMLTKSKNVENSTRAVLGDKAEDVLSHAKKVQKYIDQNNAITGGSQTARNLGEMFGQFINPTVSQSALGAGIGAAASNASGYDPLQGGIAGAALGATRKGLAAAKQAKSVANEAEVTPHLINLLLGQQLPKAVATTSPKRDLMDALMKAIPVSAATREKDRKKKDKK